MDTTQTAKDLVSEADRLVSLAEEFAKKAVKLREAAEILEPGISVRAADDEDADDQEDSEHEPESPLANFSTGTIRERVRRAMSGNFRTVPQICEATGLRRKQVYHALGAMNGHVSRRERNGQTEFYWSGREASNN